MQMMTRRIAQTQDATSQLSLQWSSAQLERRSSSYEGNLPLFKLPKHLTATVFRNYISDTIRLRSPICLAAYTMVVHLKQQNTCLRLSSSSSLSNGYLL
jgi:hypothetical protein